MNKRNFKINDIVIYSYRNSGERVCKVERTTKTMAIINTGQRFGISSGDIIGSSQWNWGSIKIATEDEIIRVNAKNIRSKNIIELERFSFNGLGDDKINQLMKYPCVSQSTRRHRGV